MSLAGRFPTLIKLFTVLSIVAASTALFACGGSDATTTTAGAGTTATAAGTAATAAGTATTAGGGTDTTAATSGEGAPSTQTSTAGELPQTPPSVTQNDSNPPQPGAEYAEQLPDLEQAVKNAPQDLDALANLAIAYYQTQSFAKAEETYKTMIDLDDRAEFHNNLANVYRDWNNIDQAVAEYQAAIELEPSSGLWYGNLAAMYMMNGSIDKAKEVAEQGIEKTSGEQREQLEQLLESLS